MFHEKWYLYISKNVPIFLMRSPICSFLVSQNINENAVMAKKHFSALVSLLCN